MYPCYMCDGLYKANYTVCTSCLLTYYLSGNSCLPCIIHCLNCTNGTMCDIC